ncbi:MAG: acyl-CoA synthetase [Pseudomonadales bacterium]
MTTYNLADLFESVVDVIPERLALIAGDVRLSYAELEVRANRLANHLLSLGLGVGDHVGIYAYNRAEWIETMWACFKIRAIPVNINYRYVEEELGYIFDNADLKALVFERRFSPLISGITKDLPLLQHFILIDDGSGIDGSDLSATSYENAMAAGSALRDFGPRTGDDIYMLYTGGTTGMPKGAMWRHEDLFFAALQGGNPAGDAVSSPEQLAEVTASNTPFSTLCPVPMMHGGGQWYCMIYQLSGNTFVLYTDPHFDAGKALQIIEQEHIVSIIIVGDAMARPLAEAIATGEHDTSSLFVIGSGGAILSKTVKDELKSLLPSAIIYDSFGASETGSGGAVMDFDGEAQGPRFTLSPNLAIVDEQLRPIAPGSETVGRLARCGHIPLGYYKDEKKTAETFPTDADGTRWVIPGDHGRVLEDGTVELLGRGSVSINSGGEKIFPEEVEAALKGHPAVFDAGVIGLPDPRFGQQVVAMVKPRDGEQPRLEDVVAYCRTRIAGYKCPKVLFLVDNIPRTPISKPDYRKLKTLAESLMEQQGS